MSSHPRDRARLVVIGRVLVAIGAVLLLVGATRLPVASTAAAFSDRVVGGMSLDTADVFPGDEDTEEPEMLSAEVAVVQALNPSKRGQVMLEVLASDAFDPLRIDARTVRFGRQGAEEVPPSKAAKHLEGGPGEATARRFRFALSRAKIGWGDVVCIVGSLDDGRRFRGCTEPEYVQHGKTDGAAAKRAGSSPASTDELRRKPESESPAASETVDDADAPRGGTEATGGAATDEKEAQGGGPPGRDGRGGESAGSDEPPDSRAAPGTGPEDASGSGDPQAPEAGTRSDDAE